MPRFKFSPKDILYNQIRLYPKSEFLIYSGSTYYNLKAPVSGTQVDSVPHIPSGHVSLYELNVDRPSTALIYPFITKGGSLSSFSTVSTTDFNSDFAYGDVISGSYPLSSSITRQHYATGFKDLVTANGNYRKRIEALRNTINFYSNTNRHYVVSSSATGRDLVEAELNMVDIPSIFFGSSIDKGTVDLKFYVTGTLVGRAQDLYKNGEIIVTEPSGTLSGTVGFALYNEGFIILTSSNSITTDFKDDYLGTGIVQYPTWNYFGSTGSAATPVHSSSYTIEFSGSTTTPVITMFAHAPKGMLNFSNNPTYIKYSSSGSSGVTINLTSSIFIEDKSRYIVNTVSSSYTKAEEHFVKQTFISKIGLYDEDNNLIAIAKMATPVRKKETDEYTFKLKLDI
jgi:hypothetical protein